MHRFVVETSSAHSNVRHLKSGGFTTRYIDAGDPEADVILLLHDGAWGGSSDVTWGAAIPLLANKYRVIAPDFLGYGGSDKATFFDRSSYAPRIDQLGTILRTLCVNRPVHVVGSSFGGSVALRLLVQSPFLLRSVTSIGGSGGLWKTDVMKAHLGRWDGTRQDLARVLSFLMDHTTAFEAQLILRQRWATDAGHYRAVASAALALPASLRTEIFDSWPESLNDLATPTLLVAGTRDELFDPEWPERISTRLRHAEIERLDARHSPNLDRPQEVAELVQRFLVQVERTELI